MCWHAHVEVRFEGGDLVVVREVVALPNGVQRAIAQLMQPPRLLVELGHNLDVPRRAHAGASESRVVDDALLDEVDRVAVLSRLGAAS